MAQLQTFAVAVYKYNLQQATGKNLTIGTKGNGEDWGLVSFEFAFTKSSP
jgi:hypothetical protein